jgi:hypothetical protein
MKYKGYYINLTPMKVDNLWRLEIEKGEEVHIDTINPSMTLSSVQDIACHKIDNLIKQELREPNDITGDLWN